LYAGAIVFYVDSTGQHGLVCAPSDQGSSQWGCFNQSLPGAFSQNLGSGLTNTNLIINGCGTRPIAASVCTDLVLNGYGDWFLPSRNELSLIYSNVHIAGIGNFSTNGATFYWSSSQSGNNNAWGLSFLNGGPGTFSKDFGYRVRPIRAF